MQISCDTSNSELWTSFIKDHKKEAFTILYKRQYGKLYAYSISLGIGIEETKDLIQDLFIKLYTQPSLIKDVDTMDSFLFVSIRNRAINWIKRSKREQILPQKESFEFNYAIELTDIEDEEDRKDIQKKINKIMSSLTPRQKEIIYLRFLHQMDYNEIAKIMGLSEQAARNLTHRAIKKAQHIDEKTFMLLLTILNL